MFVKVNLSGRQGNQMFQLAFAYLLPGVKSSFLVISPCKQFGYCLDLFDLPFSFIRTNRFKSLAPFLEMLISRLIRFKYQIFEPSCLNKNVFEPIAGNTEVTGYFQDGRSFIPYKPQLLKFFQIKYDLKSKFYEIYGQYFQKKTVVLSVRVGNYKSVFFDEIKSNGLLPQEWYMKCLTIAEKLSFDQLIVISDDIVDVKNNFGIDRFNPVFIDDSSEIQFQFLLNADILIIPNSTFAWWGAFLNRKPNKKVYAPLNWVGYNVGKEYPVGIMIDEFDWL